MPSLIHRSGWIAANPAATSYVVQRLPRGTAWFTVTTYTRLGIESDRPEPVSKEIH